MKKKWVISTVLLMTMIGGCSSESPKEKTTEKKQVEKKKEEVKKEEPKKQVSYAKPPLRIQKQEKVIYQNTEGVVRYLGYVRDKSGYYVLAIRYEGKMRDAVHNDMKIKAITADSRQTTFTKDQRFGMQVMKEGDVHYYRLDLEEKGSPLIRMDVELKRQWDEDKKNMNEITVIKLDKPEGEMIIDGSEVVSKLEYDNLGWIKEGKKEIVKVDTIQLSSSYDAITVLGSIEYKEDVKERPRALFYHPASKSAGKGDVSIRTGSSEMFEGTVVPFQATFPVKERISAKESEIYLSIDDVLYAIDLQTGKEVRKVNLTGFTQESSSSVDKDMNLFGYEDIDGNRHYNATESIEPGTNKGVRSLMYGRYQYPIGGEYTTLTFEVGAGKEGAGKQSEYTVEVYGDDYRMDEETGEMKSKPLFQKKISGNSKMEKVTVNVKGVKTVYVQYNTGIKSEMNNKKVQYIPVIFANMTLQK